MKQLVTGILFLVSLGATAQTKATSSLEQHLTLRLLDISVIQKTADALVANHTTDSHNVYDIQSTQKWLLQTQKVAPAKKYLKNFSASPTNTGNLPETLTPAQLYTFSKP